MTNDKMLSKRQKDPQEFGAKKFLVELRITSRHVVSVYANDKDKAVARALAAPYRDNSGSIRGFGLCNGVSHIQHDEDHGDVVTLGDVQEEEDGGDAVHNRSSD